MNFSKCAAFLIFFFCCRMQSAHGKFKILGLMPYNGKSHFLFAEPLFEELARRGNDVTVLSHFPKKEPFPNYHDISIAGDNSEGVHVIHVDEFISKSPFSRMLAFFSKGLSEVCIEGLAHPNVQKLLKSKDHYDVLLIEGFNADCFLPFAVKFDAPHVMIRSSALATWLIDRTGNPDHPAYVPGTTAGLPSRMNFLQRLQNFFYKIIYKIAYRVFDLRCEEVARRYFGKDMPALQDIARNTSLYLINSHYVHQYAKPNMPNVKEVAGLHVRKPRPLPQDLENWISGARHGLVYLNLGSMVKPSSLAEDKRLAFFEAFARLPHRVLMKWDSEERMQGQPDNVKLIAWAPQNDLLHHPNTKLFISHSGMLGTIEAVDAAVPIITIPLFGDQLTNAELIEERGLGVVLQYNDISFETLSSALEKVLSDPGYARRSKELSAAFRDRPVPALEEAAYWVEHVARYRNSAAANVMRSPALDLPLYQYLLLDIIAFLLLVLFLIWLLLRAVGKLMRRLIRASAKPLASKKKNN